MTTASVIVADFVNARIVSGVSQTRIAKEWGISRRQLSRYLSGENAPSDRIVALVAEAIRPTVRDFGFFPIDGAVSHGETVFSRALRSGRVLYGHADCPNVMVVFSDRDGRAYVGIRDTGIARIAGAYAHEIAFGALLQTAAFSGDANDLDAVLANEKNRAAILKVMRRVERDYVRYLTRARQDTASDLFSVSSSDYSAERSMIDQRIAELTATNTISQSGLNRMARARRQINAKLRGLR